MKTLLRVGGFTLTELLVVIAIIMILASMSFVVGPRMIERSKLASLAIDFKSVVSACDIFRTNPANKKTTLPPAYGYRVKDKDGNLTWCYEPYVVPVGLFRNMDIYDRFSMNHDTDRNGKLSLLEFSPLGTKSGADTYTFVQTIYDGTNLPQEVSQQMAEGKRPLIYIPVNIDQARVVEQYCWELAQLDPQAGWYLTRWVQPANPTPKNDVTALKFPPSRYDDFVLMSVGPNNDTGGILTPPASFLNDIAGRSDDLYHILALRAYFLATRDANENGLLDFDYNARKQGEGKPDSYGDLKQHNLNLLPNGTNGPGPVIYHNAG